MMLPRDKLKTAGAGALDDARQTVESSFACHDFNILAGKQVKCPQTTKLSVQNERFKKYDFN